MVWGWKMDGSVLNRSLFLIQRTSDIIKPGLENRHWDRTFYFLEMAR